MGTHLAQFSCGISTGITCVRIGELVKVPRCTGLECLGTSELGVRLVSVQAQLQLHRH